MQTVLPLFYVGFAWGAREKCRAICRIAHLSFLYFFEEEELILKCEMLSDYGLQFFPNHLS